MTKEIEKIWIQIVINVGKAIKITEVSMDPDPVVSGTTVDFTFQAEAGTKPNDFY